MPKVLKLQDRPILSNDKKSPSDFPIEQISASSMIEFSANPLLFKVKYINRDRFETAQNVSAVLGNAFHYAMQVYSGGLDEMKPNDEPEAIKFGLTAGMEFIEKYEEAFIKYSKTIPVKQKLMESFAFCFNSYVAASKYKKENIVWVEEEVIEYIDIEWRGQKLVLPIKLKGKLDLVYREDGKLKIDDYKTCYNYSDPDKIDGAKIIQAVEYYLLTYARTGEEPYSLTFKEAKYTKNKNRTKQVREYEIVFSENELYFDFYFRFYEDMIRALNGEMVYVPNVRAMFDNEIAIIAYIHRLDIGEEQAKLMKKHKVNNVTDLLKKEIQSAGNMRKLMKALEDTVVESKGMNYETQPPQEKIRLKLMEHGMLLNFHDVIEGATVDLYRYSPSIGLKMSRIRNYAEDVELALGVRGVRVLAPIANSTMVGFEVPRKDRKFPGLPTPTHGFDIAIGQDVMGQARRYDLREAPHILVAGASGQGKSVFLNSFINQISSNPKVELYLFDPKRVELSHHKSKAKVYEADHVEIYIALKNLVLEMKHRYEEMEKNGVRNITSMPNWMYRVIVIDEFGELMVSDSEHTEQSDDTDIDDVKTVRVKNEIERAILQIAQLGRAAGFHIVIATQSPRTDIIKGTIKANFPTKIVFKTAKSIDSMVVIDEMGAEKLAGKGDMLFAGNDGIERLQGYYS